MPQGIASLATDYYNPYAPQHLNGLNDPYPAGYVDRAVYYVQTLNFAGNGTFAQQAIPVDTSADFVWRAFTLSDNLNMQLRFLDASGTYLSNDFIFSTLFPIGISTPFPITPEVIYPAGSRIALDVVNSGGARSLQLVYIGVNRYRLPG